MTRQSRRTHPAVPAFRALCVIALLLALGLASPRALRLLAAPPPQSYSLNQILSTLDRVARRLDAVSANAAVADYTALVNDTSRSSGRFYYKRTGSGPMYALKITRPADAAKQFVYRDNTAYVYTPASRQVMEYRMGKKTQMLDQFLQLGIGGTGTELSRSYQITVDGPETLDGVKTVKLTLTPRETSLRDKIPHIDLWYDTHSWVAVQQQIWQPGGDYHLVHYTGLEINPRLDNALFPTKFPGASVIVPGS